MSVFTICVAGFVLGTSASLTSSFTGPSDGPQDSISWAYPAVSASEPDAIFSYEDDHRHICVQGPVRHMTFMLALLKSSVLGGMHVQNSLEHITCEERGFDQLWHDEEGHAVDHCFPPAQLWFEEIWRDDPLFGLINAGGLLDAMELERSLVDDLNERATRWEDDSWFTLSCNCVEGSSMSLENTHHNEESCEELAADFTTSFVTAGGHVCIEAPLRYASRTLATLRSSAAADVFGASSIEGMSCADRGFTGMDGSISAQSSCFPRAINYFRSAEDQAAHDAAMSEAASAYKQQFPELLEDIPEEVLHACNCVQGSPVYEGLSNDEQAYCDDPAVLSPVFGFWQEQSVL